MTYSSTVAAQPTASAGQNATPRLSRAGTIRNIGRLGRTNQKVAWA